MSKINKIRTLVAGLLSIQFFLLLSFFVSKDYTRNLDYQSLLNLQTFISRKFDLPFSILTLSGSSEIMLILVVVIFIYSFIKYKHLFLSLFLYFLIYIIELAGKLFIYHPKPPAVFNRYSLDFSFPSSYIVHTNFSFPSGHMSRYAFILVIISALIIFGKSPKYKKIIVGFSSLLLLSLVFISRIYLGHHWFSDVLGGLFLGTFVAALSLVLW